MSETREVLGVWTYEGIHAPRSKQHSRAREDFIYRHFGGKDKTPAYIWRVEFNRVTQGEGIEQTLSTYEMILHCYAQNAEGRRYRTWAKIYDHTGEPVNVSAVAAEAPKSYSLSYRSDGKLPPDWLLRNNPKPKED